MKAIRTIFLLLWCAMLLGPVALKVTNARWNVPAFLPFPKFENRLPAERPSLLHTPPREFGPAFDAWYSDHFAYRTRIVNFYRRLLYERLKTPIDREVPGAGDWVFRRGAGWEELEDYLGVFELTDKELDDWRTFFEGRVEWARAHGILYLQFVSSVKAQVHAEKIPPVIRYHRGRNVSTQVRDALKGSPAERHVLFIGDELRAAVQAGHETYYHEDHHPAPYGAWMQFDALNRRLREDFPDIGDMPFYENGEVPADVLAGRIPGCYYGKNRRLAVSNPGTGQTYDGVRETSLRFPYTNVATTNGTGHVSILMGHDSFMRYSLESWKGRDGSVRFPFAPGIGRVDANLFVRFTTDSLLWWTSKRLPDVIIEQFPECRLNQNLMGYDDTMRRAAAFGRAVPLPEGEAPTPGTTVRALAVLEQLRTSPDQPDETLGEESAAPVRVLLRAGNAVCASVSVPTGIRRAVFFPEFSADRIPAGAALSIELEGGCCSSSRLELRMDEMPTTN